MQKIVQNYHRYICCYGNGYMERIFRIKNGIKILCIILQNFGCGRDLSVYFWTKKGRRILLDAAALSCRLYLFRPFGIHPRTV